MRSELVSELIAYLRAQVGSSSMDDLLYRWIEEAYSVIREQTWAWNWKDTYYLTKSSLTEATNPTFTWAEGDNYITASGALALNTSLVTGRRVKLGNYYYTVIDYGMTSALRVYVDRDIVGSETTGVTKSFYRDRYVVRTNMLKNVACGTRPKLLRYDPDWFHRKFLYQSPDELDPAVPFSYIDDDSVSLPPPAFAPVVTTTGINTLANGVYYYFWTRYDPESMLESLPGPMIKHTQTDGKGQFVKYNYPASSDRSDWSTYKLRLYRSEVNPTRDRPPMFLIYERNAEVPVTPFADVVSGSLHNLPRYYEGPQTMITLLSKPDDERRSLTISHMNNWCYRTYDGEQLVMGVDNQVIELLRIYLLGLVKLAGRSPQEFRASIAQFRAQMSYLAGMDRKSGDNDISTENYRNDYSSDRYMESGDWTDRLIWGDDY